MELNANQLAAAYHLGGPCCVIAGAGSGKTAVLVARINTLLDRGAHPQRILAITFSQKAAGKMRERIFNRPSAQKVCVSTFHALGLNILRSSGYTDGRKLLREYQKIRFIEDAMKGTILEEQNAAPKHISSMIGILKGTLRRPEECLAQKDLPPDLAAIYQIYRSYEVFKKDAGHYDFDDMTDLPVYLLRENAALLATWKSRWDFILVDEYQDTNPAQDALLRLIAPPGNNVFVVGDDWQSIYGFRGADVKNILTFPHRFPDTKIVYLDTNYRSTPEIVTASNALIAKNLRQFSKKVKSSRPSGSPPSFILYEDEKAQADGVARKIKRLAEAGEKYEDMAILYRTNASSRICEESLLLRNIPFQVQGGRCFWEQPYIADVLDYLRLAVNPDDSDALLRVLNRPNRYLGNAFREAVTAYMSQTGASARKALTENPLASKWQYQKNADRFASQLLWLNRNAGSDLPVLLRYIYDDIGYRDFLKTDAAEELYEERTESIEEMLSLGEQFSAAEDLLDYVELQLIAYRQNAQRDDAVTLSTIHRAKGLEFRHVFLISCVNGVLPHSDTEDIEEERRILYVGMTRATDDLELSAVRFWHDHAVLVSPFITDIRDHLKVENAPAPLPAD